MTRIPLGNGLAATVDDSDAERVSCFRWYAVAEHGKRYAIGRDANGRNVRMHRLILGAPTGVWVDHVNGNGLDNRRENLRAATRAENGRNRGAQRNSASGFKGVSKRTDKPRRKPWRAQIQAGGKIRHLGYFATEQEAAAAYDNAAREMHGVFAKTNS
jgi:hypothetical protein